MKNSLNAYHAKRVGVRICVSIVRFVFVSCVCYLFLFPLLYLLIASIQTPESLKDPSVVWIPRELTAQNFARAAEMLDFGRSFALTAAIAVFGTLATLFSCAMAGYALARFEFLEKRLAFALVLILIIIPPQTTSMSVFLNFRFFDPLGIISAFEPLTDIDSLNLIGSPVSIILPAVLPAVSVPVYRSLFSVNSFLASQRSLRRRPRLMAAACSAHMPASCCRWLHQRLSRLRSSPLSGIGTILSSVRCSLPTI